MKQKKTQKHTHIVPAQASIDDICRIARDHTNSGDFTLMAGGDTIGITEQVVGEAPKQSFSIPRKAFNRLLRWYLKPSRIIRPTHPQPARR